MNDKHLSNGFRQAQISRRTFLGGAASVGASAAALGLFGCKPKEAEVVATPSTSGSEQPVASAPALLNPQDYDYTANTTGCANLFTSVKIGHLTLPNRVVKPAAGSRMYKKDNTGAIVEYYTRFARGGVPLIFVEDFTNVLSGANLDDFPLADIAASVHAAGSYIGYQIAMMHQNIPQLQNAQQQAGSASLASGTSMKDAMIGGMSTSTGLTIDVNAIDIETLRGIQRDAIAGAKKLMSLGFDAVELNSAGDNLGQSLMCRMRNRRQDEYGPQSIENRVRFIAEIVKGIKQECGNGLAVQVLMNGIEEFDESIGKNSECSTVEEVIEMAKVLEKAGVDSLHVRIGALGMHICQFAGDLMFEGFGIDGTTGYGEQFDFSKHWQGKLVGNHSGCGLMLNVAKEIKDAVSIPVGTVTYMDPAHAPDYFDRALADGMIDFMLINRPLTVDPDYVVKIKENRIDEIAPCTRCMHCHFDFTIDGAIHERCRVNATKGRAYDAEMPEGFYPTPAAKAKKVMVIGGGPAGMEAARIAASRGHKVTLYEKSGAIGGMLEFAQNVKGPHENLGALRTYLTKGLEVAGVDVVTGKEVDATFVKEQAPDAVIIAVGGKEPASAYSSTAGTKVVALKEFMTADLGDKVTILGCNARALDAAFYLMAQGKTINMVFPDPIANLGKGQSAWVQRIVLPMLYAKGTRVWPEASLASVGDGKVVINANSGVKVTITCDSVVDASDMLPNNALKSQLGSSFEVFEVGDCVTPYNIAEAIAAGNLAGRAV